MPRSSMRLRTLRTSTGPHLAMSLAPKYGNTKIAKVHTALAYVAGASFLSCSDNHSRATASNVFASADFSACRFTLGSTPLAISLWLRRVASVLAATIHGARPSQAKISRAELGHRWMQHSMREPDPPLPFPPSALLGIRSPASLVLREDSDFSDSDSYSFRDSITRPSDAPCTLRSQGRPWTSRWRRCKSSMRNGRLKFIRPWDSRN